MKGTVSPEMRALIRNKRLLEKFLDRYMNGPREKFTVTDEETGESATCTPYGALEPKAKKKRRSLIQLLFGK